MIHIVQGCSLTDARAASMFEDRKTLFVDLLGWDVPVVGGRYEIDSYDGDKAVYLIATDDGCIHQGSRPSRWCNFGCGRGPSSGGFGGDV